MQIIYNLNNYQEIKYPIIITLSNNILVYNHIYINLNLILIELIFIGITVYLLLFLTIFYL